MTMNDPNRGYRSFLSVSRTWLVVLQLIWLFPFVRLGQLPDFDKWVSSPGVFLLCVVGGFVLTLAAPIALGGLVLLSICLARWKRHTERSLLRLKLIGFGMASLAFGGGLFPRIVAA